MSFASSEVDTGRIGQSRRLSRDGLASEWHVAGVIWAYKQRSAAIANREPTPVWLEHTHFAGLDRKRSRSVGLIEEVTATVSGSKVALEPESLAGSQTR